MSTQEPVCCFIHVGFALLAWLSLDGPFLNSVNVSFSPSTTLSHTILCALHRRVYSSLEVVLCCHSFCRSLDIDSTSDSTRISSILFFPSFYTSKMKSFLQHARWLGAVSLLAVTLTFAAPSPARGASGLTLRQTNTTSSNSTSSDRLVFCHFMVRTTPPLVASIPGASQPLD